MRQVCFDRTRFNTIMILVILAASYLFVIYIYYFDIEKISDVDLYSGMSQEELVKKLKTCNSELFDSTMDNQQCRISLGNTKMELMRKQTFPENLGPGRSYNTDSLYQQIGIVYNDSSRFPLYGKRKYDRRSDKWEYYLIDETRNRLKIQYKSQNDNELYNNDIISIPVLSNTQFKVQLYEYDTYKYNPL